MTIGGVTVQERPVGSLIFMVGGGHTVLTFKPGVDGGLPTIEFGPYSNEFNARGVLYVLTEMARRYGIDVVQVPDPSKL